MHFVEVYISRGVCLSQSCSRDYGVLDNLEVFQSGRADVHSVGIFGKWAGVFIVNSGTRV
jgi:hypothetical protein